MSLNWLVEVSPWLHWPTGQETLRELLAQEMGLVWTRGTAIRAALIYSLYRRPVAAGHTLVLRDEQDLDPFFSHVLWLMEREMAKQCVRWMSFTHCEHWLSERLATAGYRVQDRVINLHKRSLQAGLSGNQEVLVRPAMPGDQAELLVLDNACFEPFWQLNGEIVRCALETSPYVLVADMGGTLVGYLMAERYSEAEAYISRVGVSPTVRSCGIGTRLLVEAMQWMARDGFKGVRLNTQEDNVQSRAVYASLGFEVEGEPEPIWAKELAAPEE